MTEEKFLRKSAESILSIEKRTKELHFQIFSSASDLEEPALSDAVKKGKQYNEELMQLLLKLDQISNPDLKEKRKQQVKRIQKSEKLLDQIFRKLEQKKTEESTDEPPTEGSETSPTAATGSSLVFTESTSSIDDFGDPQQFLDEFPEPPAPVEEEVVGRAPLEQGTDGDEDDRKSLSYCIVS